MMTVVVNGDECDEIKSSEDDWWGTAAADLVLAYVRGDHHEDWTSVDEDDGHHVVQSADVVLDSVEVMVAVSVAVVVASSAGGAHRHSVVSVFVDRRHETSVFRLFHAEREHALAHRQSMSQLFRHDPFAVSI